MVLKSDPDMQWCETRELLEYGFSNFRYHAVLERGEIVETLPVDNYASDDWGSLAVQVSSDDWGDVFHKDDIPKSEGNHMGTLFIGKIDSGPAPG